VYKLSALRSEAGTWDYKIKLSEQTAKTSIPGILQVRRFRDRDGLFSADAMYDIETGIQPACRIIDPTDFARGKQISADAGWEDLLVPVLRSGKQVYSPPDLVAVQKRCREQCAALHPSITRLVNPHRYPAGLESRLHEMRLRMIEQARHKNKSPIPRDTGL
jgi:nicotinate phosphoribosyltransferase